MARSSFRGSKSTRASLYPRHWPAVEGTPRPVLFNEDRPICPYLRGALDGRGRGVASWQPRCCEDSIASSLTVNVRRCKLRRPLVAEIDSSPVTAIKGHWLSADLAQRKREVCCCGRREELVDTTLDSGLQMQRALQREQPASMIHTAGLE